MLIMLDLTAPECLNDVGLRHNDNFLFTSLNRFAFPKLRVCGEVCVCVCLLAAYPLLIIMSPCLYAGG
jgi:hypothetical protein